VKIIPLIYTLIISQYLYSAESNPPENQVLVVGECKDYLVHGHFYYSIQLSAQDKNIDKLNRQLTKDLEKLIWRLKRSRIVGLVVQIVQSDIQKLPNGFKAIKSLDISLPQGQKFSEIEKLIRKTKGAEISKAQSILTAAAKKIAINKCIKKATDEAKEKAQQVAKSLNVLLKKKPLSITIEEKIIDADNMTNTGNTVPRKELLVIVKIGFQIK